MTICVAKPQFTDRQVAMMIPKYFARDHHSPPITRTRIYGENGKKVFHLEIKVNRNRFEGEMDYKTFLDFRFGNKCNFKCRMCGHDLSTAWYSETKKEYPGDKFPKPKTIYTDIYDQLIPYFDSVEEIYFAGGEPLLYPEHYKILDHFLLNRAQCG